MLASPPPAKLPAGVEGSVAASSLSALEVLQSDSRSFVDLLDGTAVSAIGTSDITDGSQQSQTFSNAVTCEWCVVKLASECSTVVVMGRALPEAQGCAAPRQCMCAS